MANPNMVAIPEDDWVTPTTNEGKTNDVQTSNIQTHDLRSVEKTSDVQTLMAQKTMVQLKINGDKDSTNLEEFHRGIIQALDILKVSYLLHKNSSIKVPNMPKLETVTKVEVKNMDGQALLEFLEAESARQVDDAEEHLSIYGTMKPMVSFIDNRFCALLSTANPDKDPQFLEQIRKMLKTSGKYGKNPTPIVVKNHDGVDVVTVAETHQQRSIRMIAWRMIERALVKIKMSVWRSVNVGDVAGLVKLIMSRYGKNRRPTQIEMYWTEWETLGTGETQIRDFALWADTIEEHMKRGETLTIATPTTYIERRVRTSIQQTNYTPLINAWSETVTQIMEANPLKSQCLPMEILSPMEVLKLVRIKLYAKTNSTNVIVSENVSENASNQMEIQIQKMQSSVSDKSNLHTKTHQSNPTVMLPKGGSETDFVRCELRKVGPTNGICMRHQEKSGCPGEISRRCRFTHETAPVALQKQLSTAFPGVHWKWA